jgi:hypothetical protein
MPHRGHRLFDARHVLDRLGLSAHVALVALFAFVTMTQARAQTSSPPDARPVFLVTDVIVGDGVPIDKDVARDALATRFGRLGNLLEVRSMAEARATVDAAALAQLTGGGTDEDLARIENYMKVDRLVLGRIASIGGIVDLQVKVFNVREGITEVAFARRLGKDADRAMVLTLLDALADNMLAWTIEHYTAAGLSTEAASLKARKLGKKPATGQAAPASPWGTSGVVGGVAAGLGAGVLGVGLYNALSGGDVSTVDIGFVAGGGIALVLGATALSIDLGNGAE